MKTLDRNCVFSPCRKYRYTLWREFPVMNWLTGEAMNADRYLMVIGLNPSTADETQDDPTIRRCVGFAERWGFGALCMTNLFAWRDTLPENMKKAERPVGDANDLWLKECASGAGMILAAWGKHGSHMRRASVVGAMIPDLHALKTNKDSSPMHPLYVAAATVPQPYQP